MQTYTVTTRAAAEQVRAYALPPARESRQPRDDRHKNPRRRVANWRQVLARKRGE